MKRIYLVRHAKSDWSDSKLTDFERPLNARGQRDAPFMATKFLEKFNKVDLIISSSAQRAMETSLAFKSALGLDNSRFESTDEIYNSGLRAIPKLINKINPNYNSVAFFGHNPDFTQLAKKYSKDEIGHLVTCSIVALSFKCNDWQEIEFGMGELVGLEYPKKYLDDANDD